MGQCFSIHQFIVHSDFIERNYHEKLESILFVHLCAFWSSSPFAIQVLDGPQIGQKRIHQGSSIYD